LPAALYALVVKLNAAIGASVALRWRQGIISRRLELRDVRAAGLVTAMGPL
jgi:hypothetical protein